MLLRNAPLHPSLCADTTAPPVHFRGLRLMLCLKTDIGIEARGNIIAYRRSGLVQRRALLRVGRRIAPCLLCVDVCAMCHSRRYALGRGTGAALVNRYCATHHDCHHTGRHSAIPLCQHSAPHVHFAPTPDC